MVKHKQLFRHRPEQGLIGDCWRTAIGCLLDMAPNEVPHFLQDCWNDNAKGNANASAWLATQGLAFVEVAYGGDLAGVMASVKSINPDTYYLLGGNSANACGHSVIACNDEIVWDPSIDDSGIVGPMDDGYFWVTWLVPLLLKRATQHERCAL